MIPQPFIDDLLARIDVVDVVGRHVKLRKAGANFSGLCPFHNEKTPSFTVSPTKQFYHCFGCGAHGNAVGFLMEHAGMSFVDAIRELAQSVGLEVPDSRGERPAERRTPGLLDALSAAAQFYKQRLKDTPRAIDYLKRRGLSGETAARFLLGYSPDAWRGLEAAVPDYADASLVEAGLVIEGEAEADGVRRKRYDRFRDRIMFPIRNPRGQIIGFGARVIDRGEPKYLNSPETPLFSKGREVYGLFEGREAIRAANAAIVVEGYMDVVMLAQHGIGNAVATLGTATTPQHVHKLLRLVDRLVFAFDGDAAGRKAAWRALEASLPEASDLKRIDFLFLPPEHDPDSFVREHGAEAFGELLARATPLSEFLIRELSSHCDLATPEGRARLLAEAKPLLLQLPPAALRMQLVQAVARAADAEPKDYQTYLGLANASARAAGASAAGGRRGWPPEDMPPADAYDADEAARAAGGDPEPAWPGPSGPGGAGWRGDGSGRPRWGDGRDRPRNGEWRGGRGGRTGSWSGRDGRWGDRGAGGYGRGGWGSGGYTSRSSAAAPDLVNRACLLLALHPGLAHEPFEADLLPEDLLDWIARVAAQPPGIAFACLIDALRPDAPERAASVERAEAAERGLLETLEVDDARKEFRGAMTQLKRAKLRQQIDALAAGGLSTPEERERYALLQELQKKLSGPEST